jgi:hypothetical protein
VGIDNTTERMKDTAEQLLFLGEGMVTGSASSFIERQEAAGQRQLVSSELLPADHGDDAPWLALGFTFGEPVPGDPLFVKATLPSGWEKRATDHSMGSVVVDTLGRERVSIFYKAAYYDRRASMHLTGLHWYVTCYVEYDGPLVLSGDWATRDAVLETMRAQREENLREAAEFRGYADNTAVRDEDNRSGCAGIAARKEEAAAKYEAAIAELERADAGA